MRVKHKDSEKGLHDTSMTLEHWQKTYLPNKKYLNYEFYDVPKIVDLYEIDETTGNTIFLRSTFEHSAKQIIRNEPKKYVSKTHDNNNLDEYLMPKKVDYLGVSFFKRIKAKIQQIISPSQNPNTIPFSRFEKWSLILMALAVIVPICIYIITELNN